ncbi:hypothetical protein TBS_03370 [Thermobispora bispora]
MPVREVREGPEPTMGAVAAGLSDPCGAAWPFRAVSEGPKPAAGALAVDLRGPDGPCRAARAGPVPVGA